MKRFKKLLMVLLAATFLIGGSGTALAAPNTNNHGVNADDELAVTASGATAKMVTVLKQFEDEYHQLAALESEFLGMKQEEVQKKDQILSLTIDAVENDNKDALQEARKLHQDLKKITKDIQNLTKQAKDEQTAFRQACKGGDLGTAGTHITNEIDLRSQINVKLQEKLGIFDQIISVLS